MTLLREAEMSPSDAGLPLPGSDAAQRWYVVMTQPRKEHFAAQNLQNQGFQSFVPRQMATYRHARRFSTRLAVVFSQYIFVSMNPYLQRWRSVNGTLGVRILVGNSDGPVPVRAGVVETLLASCDRNGVLMFQPASALKPGDRVRLVAGPFAGAMGSLQSLDASGRVRLLLDIMSGKITAIADIANVSREP
jgi:transcriptional antiterminator RfaH